VDFSTFIKKLADDGRLSFRAAEAVEKITYHDSCHLKRTLMVFREPRDLLRQSGHEISEMFESDMCCGMGGSYSLKNPEIASHILKRKIENINKTEASCVAMDCPACVLQIKGGFDKEGKRIRVKHTAELLAEKLK